MCSTTKGGTPNAARREKAPALTSGVSREEKTMDTALKTTLTAAKGLKQRMPGAADSDLWFVLLGLNHPAHLITEALNALAGEAGQ